MEKVVKFLEEKVEWIALALGGLFFLWMVWGNVITPPGTVEMNGRTYAAGEVDRAIAESSAVKVDNALNSRGRLPSDWAPHSFVNDFVSALSPTTRPTSIAFEGVQRSVVPPEEALPDTALARGPGAARGGLNPNAAVARTSMGKLENLPVPPPAEPFGVLAGMSSVTPLPGQAIAAAAIGPNGQPVPIDKAWASVSFKVSSTLIAQAFTQAKVPSGMKTLFLVLEAVREEQLPDGKWGKSTVIHTPYAPNQPGYPTPGLPRQAALTAEATYLTWARSNETYIIQPPFYAVTAGTPWTVPGFDIPRQVIAFDPRTYTGDLTVLTPEQKQAVMQARRDAAKQRQQQRAAPRGPVGPTRGGRGGPGGDVEFAPRPAVSYQVRPPYGGPPRGFIPNPDMAPEDMGMEEPGFGGQPQFQAGQLTPEQQAQLRAPTTDFDPTTFDTIIVWVHDDSVEPGKTYHYKLRYRLLNPIYQVTNVATNPALSDKFDLVTDDAKAAWSSNVDVPARTQFFVRQGIAPSSNSVTFELFNFSNGRIWSKVTPVQIGDVVGAPDMLADYTTNWTVVDIRASGTGVGGYALLVDDQGRLVRRDFDTDRNDTRYRDLKDQYAAQPPLPQTTATVIPGFVPVR